MSTEAALERYLQELARWGARINLVGSTDRDALAAHAAEALTACDALPRGARVVDLGSGAGLPGVPIAIARPDLSVVLVEIRERRVHFLRHVARTLDLDLEVRRADLNDAPDDPFDVALSRAVSAPSEILPRAARWVVPGGEIWLWTRLTPDEAGVPAATAIPLPADRGAILRIPEAAIPRGTPPSP